MDYDRMSNRRLYQVIKFLMPGLPITDVHDDNRRTIIAYIKVFEGMGLVPIKPKRSTNIVN